MSTLAIHGPTGRGFTLVELAVVVAVIAALMTLGLTFLNAQITSAAYSTTKKRQEVIKDALIAYLGAHRRLPCPVTTFTPGTPIDGNAPAPGGGPPPVCPPGPGVIPYQTLGLSRDIAEDGWGNLFSYQIYADPSPICPGQGRNWGHELCFGEGKGGGIVVNDGVVPTGDVIAVVVSHGPNGLGGYAIQGTRNAAPMTCEEAHNAVGTTPPTGCTPTANTFFKGERPENDDVVAYLTATGAIQSLVRERTIKSPIARASEDLQNIYDRIVGLNLAQACTYAVPDSIELEENPGRDPWGGQYSVLPHNTPSDPDFSICLCTAGGTGTIPSPYPCAPTSPAICKSINHALYHGYRARAGVQSDCLPPP